jgi:hypothetical protein
MVGYTSSIFPLPATNIAVVVLKIYIQLNSAADRVGELLLEALRDNLNPHYYKLLAKITIRSTISSSRLAWPPVHYTSPFKEVGTTRFGRWSTIIITTHSHGSGHETKLSNTPGFHMLRTIFTRLNSRLAKMRRLGRYCWLMRLAGLIQNSLRGRTEKQQLRMTSFKSHSKYCKCPYLKTLYSIN